MKHIQRITRNLRIWIALPIYVIVQACYIPSGYALPHTLTQVNVTTTAEEGESSIWDGLAYRVNDQEWSISDLGNMFLITNSDDLNNIKIIEKLPNGAFGRLLRYRGWFGSQRVDLEFIYQDRERVITILDYQAGRFYRTKFMGKTTDNFSVFPLNNDADGNPDLSAYQLPSAKFYFPKASNETIPHFNSHPIETSLQTLSQLDVWSKRLIRGPPEEGIQS